MQTKLTDHVTEMPSSSLTSSPLGLYNSNSLIKKQNSTSNNQSISNSTKEKSNNNENDLDSTDSATPKSKRIRMTLNLDKQLNCSSAKVGTLLSHKFGPSFSASIPFNTKASASAEKILKFNKQFSVSKTIISSQSNSKQTPIKNSIEEIDLTISPEKNPSDDEVEKSNNISGEKSSNFIKSVAKSEDKALKELDSNDESLNTKKKSLRKQETDTFANSTDLKVFSSINQEHSNKKTLKREQPASDALTTTTNKSEKTSVQTQKSSKNLNTFACLRNLGSTCYINCIIQVMRYTPGFVISIHRLNKQIDYLETMSTEIETEINLNNNIKFVKNLHQLLEEMSDKEKQDRRPIYSPAKFVKTVWTLLSFWSNGSQQDAHEFLQYTIHFINECDLFIRKIHQQYQLKQMSFTEETLKIVFPDSNHQTADGSTFNLFSNVVTKTRKTKNSLKTAADQIELNSSLEKHSSNLDANSSQDTNPNKQTKIDRRRKEYRNKQIEKENFISHDSSQSNDSSTSSSLQIVMNQKLSDRLVKSMPSSIITEPSTAPVAATAVTSKIVESLKTSIDPINNNNFLRTPTKGGRSSSNMDDIPCLQESIGFKKYIVNSSKSYKTENSKADDAYQFKDDEEMTYDIKVKFKNNIFEENLMEVDEKDLVSKRLKETVNKTPEYIQKKRINNDSSRYQEGPAVKLKRDNIRSTVNLNDSINSIIIIDSDDDELEQINERKINNRIEVNDPKEMNMDITDKNFYSRVDKNETLHEDLLKFEQNSVKDKKLDQQVKVSLGKFDLSRILKENTLILSKESIDYIKQTELSNKESGVDCFESETKKQTNSIVASNNANSRTRNNMKKLGSKTKTFGTDQSLSNNEDSMEKTYKDLDAITIINLVKTVSNHIETNNKISSSSSSSAKNFKTKLRSTSTGNSSLGEDANSNLISLNTGSPFLLASNLIKTFTECESTTLPSNLDNNFSKLPPSPAELLRKYSITNGYTCEMDKLFKGSSVTVTQCLECENLRKCPEAFYDRSIPLDTNDDSNEDDGGINWIAKCLSNESYLNDNSKYMCDKCASKQEAKIHTQYTQMPNILILHLLSYGITSSIDGNMNAQKLSNRSRLVNYFDYISAKEQTTSLVNYSKFSNEQISPNITCNLKRQRKKSLDFQTDSNSLKHHFKLFAVVMHSGSTLNSGHYTAYVNYKIVSQSNGNKFTQQSANTPNSLSKSDKSCSCFINNNKTIQNSQKNGNNNNNNADLISSKYSNDSEWLHFDDTKVKSLSNIEFHRKIIDSNYDSPYILFYVKE